MKTKKYNWLFLIFCGLLLTSCKDDEAPEPENVSEIITDVTLTFTNTENSSDIVTATAKDPDGEWGGRITNPG